MPIRDVLVSGMRAIGSGLFGIASPNLQLSAPQMVQGDTPQESGLYGFREGPIFTPGAMNYVLQPFQETPVQPIWGHGFLRNPAAWNMLQPPQVYSSPTVVVNGMGGPVAGFFELQPLLDRAPEQGG